VDGLLIALRNGGLGSRAAFKFADLFLLDQDGVSSLLLGEVVGVRLDSTLGLAERCTIALTRVGATLEVEFTRQIRADGLGRGVEAERGGGGLQVSWVLTSMALWLGRNVLLLGDQVVRFYLRLTTR